MARSINYEIIFQSTLPQEERRKLCSDGSMPKRISIHAPTRGATFSRFGLPGSYQFQSTLPQEERPRPVHSAPWHHYFNPRSHKRSDAAHRHQKPRQNISIHAPTRGATMIDTRFVILDPISIHAPTRGATPALLPRTGPGGNFNPRSHKRSDRPYPGGSH